MPKTIRTNAPLGLRLINTSLLGDCAMDESTDRAIAIADQILDEIPRAAGGDRDRIIALIKRECERGNLQDGAASVPLCGDDGPLAGLTYRDVMLIEQAFQVGVATAWQAMRAFNGSVAR
jgi:hypothetical protein